MYYMESAHCQVNGCVVFLLPTNHMCDLGRTWAHAWECSPTQIISCPVLSDPFQVRTFLAFIFCGLCDLYKYYLHNYVCCVLIVECTACSFGCCYWHLLPWIWLLLLVLTSLDLSAVIGTYFTGFGCCYWYLFPWIGLLLLALTSLDLAAVIGTYFPVTI